MTARPKISSFFARPLLALYSFGISVALVVTAPWWWRELRMGGKYREGLWERLGRVPRARLLSGRLLPDRVEEHGRGLIWVHAVSVGEVLAAAPLVVRLRAALPDGRVVVSTTTRTGQALARKRFGNDCVFYFPADFAFAVRAWMRFLQPALIVLVESEFWPRFLYEADRAGVPVAVVNARVSARSWPRYRRLRALWRPLLGTLALVQAQTAEDRDRLRLLGARHACVGGNLKYDALLPPGTALLAAMRDALPAGVPVLVCGSTLAGEEALLLGELPAGAVVLLAPRHPERFDEVATMLAEKARHWLRLSAWLKDPGAIVPGTILLLDSIGELAALYATATVAVVGGGFLHAGGHNPLEPAVLGKAIVMGPGYANFVEVVRMLEESRAVVVAGAGEIGSAVARLLAEPAEAAAMGARARAVCVAQAGATERAVAALLPLVRALEPR